ncbi:MAG: hypothetical protein CW716_10285 [Candidatus Bathyarchaeum sp.]|nr:MAG: hypothetical protein CW716_10285 [Candidatus Bathyarchaeum sp.]
MWLAEVMPGAAVGNDIRFHDYTLTITQPNGETEKIVFDVCYDTTSAKYYGYYPNQIGAYTFKFDFPGQTYTWSGDFDEGFTGDYYLPSSAETTLYVQEDPISAITSYPLPKEYWTRPIYGENTDWWSISSNWLGEGGPQIKASFAGYQVYVPDAVGSLTSHVMWTSRVQSGGVVGGESFPISGDTYFDGTAYLPRFENPIIMDGMLFYKEPYAFASCGFRGTDDGAIVCVDLRTGEELWRERDMPSPTFGLIFNVQNRNQHGVHQPLLVAPVGTTWMFYDAFTGYWLFNATNVPSGSDAMGTNGEFMRYVFLNQGTEENPEYALGQWNSSKLWYGAEGVNTDIAGEVRDASVTSGNDVRYDWIAPLPWLDQAVSLPDWGAAGVRSLTPIVAYEGDLLLCYNGTLPASRTRFGPASWEPYTYFAINLNKSRGDLGEVLWWKTYEAPPGNITVGIGGVDQENRIWLEEYKETSQWVAYSMETGERLWGPTEPQANWDYYGTAGMEDRIAMIAHGKVYSMMFSGILYCYDELTGKLLWTYGNSDEDGNSTRAGYQNAYGVYPTLIMAMGRDMIYAAATEHTVNTPIYKGARVICIDADNGNEVWDLSSFVNSFHSISLAIADGYTTWWNGYCNQIFTTGKGPSQTTVTASPKVTTSGSGVIIEGTVMDLAAGTNQNEQAARFPNGVAAVSDASMTDWMEYVYMQRPRPTDTVGVEVIIEALYPDNSFREIGRATTDSTGMFSLKFEPTDQGTYTIVARFEGTNGYWPSFAETSVGIDPAPTTEDTDLTSLENSVSDIESNMSNMLTYILAILVIVIIALLVAIFSLLKSRK